MTWWQTDRPVRERFVSAYIGCADFGQLLFFLAIATMNSLDAAPCVAAGWSGVLTPHLLASSLAYGTGLDDLPPATVGPLVDATLRCMSGDPDWTDWWIDDVVLELDGVTGIPPSAAECIATNYVRELGIERVVERRVLTLPVLTLTAADLAAIDAPGCGADLAPPALALGQVGDCLADVFRTAVWPVVACTSPHNGEILDVTDLTGVVTEWPGWSAMNDRGRLVCTAAADAARQQRSRRPTGRSRCGGCRPRGRHGRRAGGSSRASSAPSPTATGPHHRVSSRRRRHRRREGRRRVVPAQSPLAGGGDGWHRHLVGLAPHRHRHRSVGPRGPVLTDREVAAAPTAADGLPPARCGDRPRQLPGERGGGGAGVRGRVADRRSRSCVWSSRSASPTRSPASRGRCAGSCRSPCPRSAATGAIA